MPKLKRRHFLQLAGSTLATVGLSQLDIIRQGHRYAQVLAQNTPRKLALLVGVNDYPAPIPRLQGCLTDVELQYELLVRRFGFNPQDILMVTDDTPIKPTRQGIIDAVETHLIQQAKPGDVVVFHYSGHGSRVIDPNPINPDGLNSTMVPNNRQIETGQEAGKVRDIMGKTLFLWMSALDTENVTVVMDSCHSGGGLRGNFLIRAVPSRQGSGQDQASQEEFEYQQQWLSRLKLTPEQFQQRRHQGIAKGVALGSAARNQLATDAPFGEFHAGAFTYLLTRYLWQQPISEPLSTVFVNLARSTKDVANSSGIVQDPVYEVKPGSDREQEPIYLLNPSTPAAEAVVRKIEGDRVEFWLGGVSSQSLEAFQEGAIFTLINQQGQVQGEVEQTSRVGLVGYGTMRSQGRAIPGEGMLMRERVRGVPADLSLRVGLDSSLGETLSAARTALQSVSRVTVVPMNQEAVVDYVVGRMTNEAIPQAQHQGMNPLPPVGSLGVFTAGLIPVPDSFGVLGESVEAGVNRLRPRLKALLAGRILHLVLNSDTSNLNVAMMVQPVAGTGVGIRAGSRAAKNTGVIPTTIAKTSFKQNTEIQVEVQNHENQGIYVGVLAIGSNGDIVVLFPYWDAPEDSAFVPPGQRLIVPPESDSSREDDFHFILEGVGFVELLVLASTEPLRDALKGVQKIARSVQANSRQPLPLAEDEPVEIMEAFVNDLDRHSRGAGIKISRGIRGVDTQKLAALSAMIEVIE